MNKHIFFTHNKKKPKKKNYQLVAREGRVRGDGAERRGSEFFYYCLLERVVVGGREKGEGGDLRYGLTNTWRFDIKKKKRPTKSTLHSASPPTKFNPADQ